VQGRPPHRVKVFTVICEFARPHGPAERHAVTLHNACIEEGIDIGFERSSAHKTSVLLDEVLATLLIEQ
jgi:hypothetical protein